jgi:hypothetical protein
MGTRSSCRKNRSVIKLSLVPAQLERVVVFVIFCFRLTSEFSNSVEPEIGFHSHTGRIFLPPTSPICSNKGLFEIDLDRNLETPMRSDVK